MTAIALLTEAPTYCPGCGASILGTIDQYTRQDWRAHCTFICPSCRLLYQLVDREHALAAATASGGDLAQCIDR